MASIEKTKSGKYKAIIYVGRDAAGKKIREFITCDGKKECELAAKKRELEIEELGYNSISKMRFSAYADKWLEIEKSRLAPSTYVAYKMYINTHFKPYFGDTRLDKIIEMHIKEYISQKLKKLKPVTVRKHFFTLSAILYSALKIKSPMRDLTAPDNSDYQPYILEDEEFTLFHNAVRGMYDEIILLLIAWNGMRPGEIFALSKDDIHFNKEEIHIDENKAISEDGYIYKKPKSKKGVRIVATHPYLMGLLKEHIKNNMDKQRLFSINPNAYSGRWDNIKAIHNKLFVRKQECVKKEIPFDQKPKTGQNKKSLAVTLNIQDKPLPNCRFYDLRHYHASVLYKCEVPDQYAADRMGHDVAVLKKVYQHLQAKEEGKLHDKIKTMFTP